MKRAASPFSSPRYAASSTKSSSCGTATARERSETKIVLAFSEATRIGFLSA
jgi:hypothetical protein